MKFLPAILMSFALVSVPACGPRPSAPTPAAAAGASSDASRSSACDVAAQLDGLSALSTTDVCTVASLDTVTTNQLNTYFRVENRTVADLDEDCVTKSRVVIECVVYDMITMYSGGNQHGALFRADSSQVVGGNSDGDVFLVRKDYIDQNDINPAQ